MAEVKRVNKRAFLREHRKDGKALEMVRIFSSNYLAMIGLVIFLIILIAVIFANVIADYNSIAIATHPADRLLPPSAEHWFGTDDLGRDVFARVLHGSRISLRISVGAGFLGLFIAGTIGSVAGFYGGVVDNILMRVIDVLACVPCIVLAIAMVAAFGASEFNLILAIAVSTTVGLSRTVRTAVMSVRNMEYVEAARAIGQSTWKIIPRHILINCIAPIIVHLTIIIACNILTTAELSFLGLGISAPTPEWGCMIAMARTNMRSYPYLVIAPGVAIFLSAISFNLIGDGLRDALDPKLKR
ncbi:MAG: ABC transporter permease [Eubacteriales bacterium]|nr:ABC transporter permease [Eubacteriales bacterium]